MPKFITTAQTPEKIKNIAKRMADCSTDLIAIAQRLTENGFETIDISRYQSVSTGMKKVESFVEGARAALWEAMENRGDFSAVPVESGPANASKAKKNTKTKKSGKTEKKAAD